jgi:hypothetical protein
VSCVALASQREAIARSPTVRRDGTVGALRTSSADIAGTSVTSILDPISNRIAAGFCKLPS